MRFYRQIVHTNSTSVPSLSSLLAMYRQNAPQGSNQGPVNVRPQQAADQMPEIRKYKKRFNSEINCASLWGVNLLIGTNNGLLLLDRSGQGTVFHHKPKWGSCNSLNKKPQSGFPDYYLELETMKIRWLRPGVSTYSKQKISTNRRSWKQQPRFIDIREKE